MTVLLHTGDDRNFKGLFNATVHQLMMGNCGPTRVGFDVLEQCCNSINSVHLFVYITVIESQCTECSM
jgi:hypothetical protein